MTITRRLLLLGSSCLAMIASLPRLRFAAAQTAKLTFVLVNDIYLMNENAGPDGRKRGGFPRLAAIVKAERAKAAQSAHVLFAHAGDTLSPSLMSGIDHGFHIVSLHQHDSAGHLRARQSRIRLRQGDVPAAAWAKRNFRSSPPICATPTARRCRASRTAPSSTSAASGSD